MTNELLTAWTIKIHKPHTFKNYFLEKGKIRDFIYEYIRVLGRNRHQASKHVSWPIRVLLCMLKGSSCPVFLPGLLLTLPTDSAQRREAIGVAGSYTCLSIERVEADGESQEDGQSRGHFGQSPLCILPINQLLGHI